MKLGDELNGYRVITEPTNAGAGMSQWAIADKGGGHYFIKMYLSPKYPLPESPGSEKVKERRRAECKSFEDRQLEIVKRLRPDAPGGGHLVTTLEFFRVSSSYYKITKLVQVGDRVSLADCTPDQQSIALRSLLFSLKILHDQDVVHGDLKPENVLFQETRAGAITCKLIDFDEAYVSGSPPPADRIVGDPRYYSPELFRYVKGDPGVGGSRLTTKSDMFALGVLIYAMLSGGLPGLKDEYQYPCEQVLHRTPLVLRGSAVPHNLRAVLVAMLSHDPGARPTIDEVIAAARGEEAPSVKATPKRSSPPAADDVPKNPTGKAPPPVGAPRLRSTFGPANPSAPRVPAEPMRKGE